MIICRFSIESLESRNCALSYACKEDMRWIMFGPLFIVLCMFLRGTDILFRKITLSGITPLELITLEHLIACIALLPLLPNFRILKKLSAYDLFCLAFVSFGASVLGILCFTTAFNYINPAIVILLQKLQPVVTIFLSVLILKETIHKGFYLWATIAILSGYILSFGFTLPALSFQSLQFKGIFFALLYDKIFVLFLSEGSFLFLLFFEKKYFYNRTLNSLWKAKTDLKVSSTE